MALRAAPSAMPASHPPAAWVGVRTPSACGPAPTFPPPSLAGPAGAACAALGLGAALGTAAAARARGGVSLAAKKEKKVAQDPAPRVKAPPPFDPAEQIGAVPPLGYFDPLGICAKGDRGRFRNFREAELKHGRVAMLASVGLVGQHYLKFPGFEKMPSGIFAGDTAPASYAWYAIIAICGFVELNVWKQDPKKEIGDFGDPLGLNMYNDEMRNKEINNGRFAMLSVAEIARNEQFTKKDAVQQFEELISSAGFQMPAMPSVEMPSMPAAPALQAPVAAPVSVPKVEVPALPAVPVPPVPEVPALPAMPVPPVDPSVLAALPDPSTLPGAS